MDGKLERQRPSNIFSTVLTDSIGAFQTRMRNAITKQRFRNQRSVLYCSVDLHGLFCGLMYQSPRLS